MVKPSSRIKSLFGIEPVKCRSCKTRFSADEQECQSCGTKRRAPRLSVLSLSCLYIGLAIIAFSGVIYAIEVFLEPYTHQFWVDTLSMNYQRDSYVGTVAGPICVVGVLLVILAFIFSLLVNLFVEDIPPIKMNSSAVIWILILATGINWLVSWIANLSN